MTRDGAARAAAARWHWREAFLLIVGGDRGGEPGALAVGAGAARETRRGEPLADAAARARRAAARSGVPARSRCASAPASAPRWRCRRCGSPPGCATSPAGHPAEVARGLLAVNVVDDRRLPRASAAPPTPGSAAAAARCRCSLRRRRAVLAQPRPAGRSACNRCVLWCLFVGRRHRGGARPTRSSRAAIRKEMAGRANTAVNVLGFVGMFGGQWGIGAGARPLAAGARRLCAPRAIPGRSAWCGRCSSPAWPGCGPAGGCVGYDVK